LKTDNTSLEQIIY